MGRNWEKFDKNSIKCRASLRGIKKCPSCGCVNGQRALICRNTECVLRQKTLASVKPFDPIQLVTHSKVLLFSIRSKQKLANLRNFVCIAQKSTESDVTNASNDLLKTFCYVDSCKFDCYDSIQISCKHVNACSGQNGPFNRAVVYNVDKSVLWNLNISEDQKQSLWNLCKRDEKLIPAVQRINGNVFAVKCLATKTFPAGRLHVTVFANAATNRKGTYMCACKRLKIVLEADNSVTMQNEICNHILLVLGAILSKPDAKTHYSAFLEALQSFWMPTTLNVPLDEDNSTSISMFNEELGIQSGVLTIGDKPMSLSLQNQFTDDLFNFSEELFSDCMLPDFSDIPSDIQNAMHSNVQHNLGSMEFKGDHLISVKDPKLISNVEVNKDEDLELKPLPTNKFSKTLQVAYQLNEGENSIVNDCRTKDKGDEKQATDLVAKPPIRQKQCSLLKPLNTSTAKFVNRAQHCTSENEQQIIYVSATGPIQPPTIIAVQPQPRQGKAVLTQSNIAGESNTMPSISFEDWLKHIIEVLNETVDVKASQLVKHSFDVHEDVFAYFSKTFALNHKRRLPNNTTIVKSGKYRDLIKYTWYFTQSSTVQRIFSTKHIKFEMERLFYIANDGSFRRYIPNTITEPKTKGRLIYPKLQLYTAFVNFHASDVKEKSICHEVQRMGVKLEWLPMTFPKSKHGIMTIEFQVGVRENVA